MSPSTSKWLGAWALVAVLGGVAIVWRWSDESQTSEAPASRMRVQGPLQGAREQAPVASAPSLLQQPNSEPIIPSVSPALGYQPPPETGPDAEALTQIEAAAVTYTPDGVTALAPFLLHAVPAVRARAVDALIRLGEAGGANALREAAAKTKDPREAVRMLDAADFIELPPAKNLSKLGKPKP